MPEPTSTPTRVLSSFSNASALSVFDRPAFASAFLDATMVYLMQSSYRRADFLSIMLHAHAADSTLDGLVFQPGTTHTCVRLQGGQNCVHRLGGLAACCCRQGK